MQCKTTLKSPLYKCCTILIALILAGCVSTNNIKTIYNQHNEARPFDGLVDAINASQSDVNIMFLHGMDGYASRDNRVDPCFVTDDVRNAYGLAPASYPFPGHTCSNTFRVDNKNIQLRALHWSDLTLSRKWRLESIDADPNMASNRAGVTNMVRQHLINDGFSDALMYTGVYREPIIQRVIDNIQEMNEAQPGAINIFITFSLGSSILLDAIEELEKRGSGKLLEGRVELVYMLANQVPLINLGTEKLKKSQPIALSEPGPYRYLEKVLNTTALKAEEKPKVRVIAFTDPNDLLSYPLDASSMGNLQDVYVNVAVSVAQRTYYIPFLKEFSVVNYFEAHTGYVYNDSVRQLLLYGYHSPSAEHQ